MLIMNTITEGFVTTSFKKVLSKLLSIALVLFFASNVAVAQNVDNINFKVDGCSLDVALEKLYKDYGINLAFNRAELSNVMVGSYSAEAATLEQVLTSLLADTGFAFKKIGSQYVIRKSSVAKPSSSVPMSNPSSESTPKPRPQSTTKKSEAHIAIPDTIRVVDTIIKKEIVYRTDTIREKEIVLQTDTVVVYKYASSRIKKLRRNIFSNDYSHHKDFSVSLSVSQNTAFYGDHLTNATEYWYEFYKKSFKNYSFNNFSAKVNGAYNYNRFQIGVGISFSSFQRQLDFRREIVVGDYFEMVLLDSYYTYDPISNDTLFYYIYDSTYVPRQEYVIEYNDINRLGYLGLIADIAYCYYSDDNIKLYVKGGVGASFLLYFNGSLISTEEPFLCIDKTDNIQKFKVNAMVGLGARVTLNEQVELVPEISYHNYFGSVYTKDSPVRSHIDAISLGVGLIYYF